MKSIGFALGRVGYDKSASSVKSLLECSWSISVLDRKTKGRVRLVTVGKDRAGKRVGLLLQGSTSNTLSSAPQSHQYWDRWTQLPHYEHRGETMSLWPHLCQHLQMVGTLLFQQKVCIGGLAHGDQKN